MVQNLRKESNLDVSDRIDLTYNSENETILQALSEHKDYITEQVLALSFTVGTALNNAKHEELGEGNINFAISKH